MASANTLPFLDMFPFCEALSDLSCGEVTGCTVQRETRSIEIKASFKKFIPPAYLNQAEELIRRRFFLLITFINSSDRLLLRIIRFRR